MSKFFPNLKDISSKLNGSTSTEPESASATDAPAKQRLRQMTVRRQVKRRLLQLQRVSRKCIPPVLLKPLTGPKPLYRYLLLAGLGVSGTCVALGVGWLSVEKSLPEVKAADVISYARSGTLTIAAANGTILEQSGPVTREKLKIWQIPQPLINAFIATEDRRFYQHHGVDYQGILRAVFSNLHAGGVVEGGSTLTQQLARIVYLDQKRSFTRKIKEFRLAQKIEQNLNKEQILERYLNLVYLGEGAYGVADAAWVYFSKPVDELTLPEMALLAGLPPAPNEYSPFVNKQAALARRNIVLQRMQEAGNITPAEAKAASAAPITLTRSPLKDSERQAPYFTKYIELELPKYLSPQQLQAGGVTVETTLNPEWQKIAEETVKNTIAESGRGYHFKQAALVAIDPRSGKIRAMVGGKDFYHNQFNRVIQAKRQPGSTFKAFVYTTAIAAGFDPYRSYLDSPLDVDGYTPKNFSPHYRGWITMRDGLINSINVVALKVLMDVGWDPTIQVAHKMGIESELQPFYSLALGGSEVNLLELTSAYGTFANKGMHVKPYGIRRIFDASGKIIYDEKIESSRAIDEETSAIMTWLLRGVVNEGTGRAAQLDRPVAGKTGTTDEARDLWFVGFIPQLVAGVWLGNDNNDITWGSSGIAADTWHTFMAKAIKDIRPAPFPPLPEDYGDRKAQIQVQPIHPKHIRIGDPDPEKSSDDNNSRTRTLRQQSDDDNTPRYQRRSRRRQQNQDDM